MFRARKNVTLNNSGSFDERVRDFRKSDDFRKINIIRNLMVMTQQVPVTLAVVAVRNGTGRSGEPDCHWRAQIAEGCSLTQRPW